MGMYDEYFPDPAFLNAHGLPLDGWQGKNAYRVLDKWVQGQALPQDLIDFPTPAPAFTPRLPDVFYIYHYNSMLRCFCDNGIWTRCEVVNDADISNEERLFQSEHHQAGW